MGAVARGLWLELRVIPVLLWSFSAITLGTALGGGSDVEGWYYLGAVALGVLIQGVLAHTLNEIEDWRSGTDRHDSPRVISGGSKVLVAGLLTPRALKLLFAVAFVATTVLGLALVASRGLVMLPFGLAGVAGAVLYTLPPVRAAYRPFLGEAVACICLWLCVTGAAVLQGGTIDATVAVAALAVAAYAVGMLMVHHYLDYEADRSATPTKTHHHRAAGPGPWPPLRDRMGLRRAGVGGRRRRGRAEADAARRRLRGRARLPPALPPRRRRLGHHE